MYFLENIAAVISFLPQTLKAESQNFLDPALAKPES